MTEIIGVRFKDVGKIYYFSPSGSKIECGNHVIVETARGIECGEVVIANRKVDDKKVIQPLKSIMRIATEKDLETQQKNREKEQEIMKVFTRKISEHKLDMKPIDIDCTFDGSKILFYFTAENRVDFRELVKDLASVYRTRIELRQIGVRDEAKMLGGLGICGRPFCCKTFLGEFQPVSIKMAKEQSLSLNPTKISGTCGRLMCCLKNEQEAYEDLIRRTPQPGSVVKTPDGKGSVVSANLLKSIVSVSLDIDGEKEIKEYKLSDIKILKKVSVKIDDTAAKDLKELED